MNPFLFFCLDMAFKSLSFSSSYMGRFSRPCVSQKCKSVTKIENFFWISVPRLQGEGRYAYLKLRSKTSIRSRRGFVVGRNILPQTCGNLGTLDTKSKLWLTRRRSDRYVYVKVMLCASVWNLSFRYGDEPQATSQYYGWVQPTGVAWVRQILTWRCKTTSKNDQYLQSRTGEYRASPSGPQPSQMSVRGCKKVTTQNHRFCHKPGVAEAFNRPCGAITCPNWVTLCFLALLILDLVLLMGWKDFQLMPWIRQVPGPFCGLSFCCLCRFLSHATGTKTCRSKPSPSCRAALKEKSRHEKVPHLKVVGKICSHLISLDVHWNQRLKLLSYMSKGPKRA